MASTNESRYLKVLERGQRLHVLLQMDQDTLKQQPGRRTVNFTDHTEMVQHSWEHGVRHDPHHVSGFFRPVYQSLGASVGVNDNLRFTYWHGFAGDGYEIAINRDIGIISAIASVSPIPRDALGEPLPGADSPILHHWSDFAFFAWKDVAQNTTIPLPPGPRYITRIHIQNNGTVSVLNALMMRRGHKLHPANEYSLETDILWPGEEVRLDKGSEEGLAILGTLHGAGVAHLLIDRKEEFGHLVLRKVNVFYRSSHYNLVFETGEA